ncbi:MAG: VacJ family lipoprotein [Proteobacteria bacterium]|nr:VacJ family lipoprotein [Pseudomonadota bacterium]MDA1323766.1 VacJ family lipoprotein [Pseudomonadota bacterium]
MTIVRRYFTPIIVTAFLTTAFVLPVSGQEVDQANEAGKMESNDALEGINRVTSGFNRVLRQWVIDPAVDGYQAITPEEVQQAVSNVASNLTEPLTVVSSLLQGDTDNAATAAMRFLINTIAGIGGIGDLATEDGYVQRREDLGQALGANGVEPGPHIVLPIIGPSNFRDAAGDIAVFFTNPLPTIAAVAAGGVEYSGKQDTVKAIGDNAVDPYVAERDAYEQNRQFVINNGARVEIPMIAETD